MLHDTVCSKGQHGCLIRVLVSVCDDFQDCDISIMMS